MWVTQRVLAPKSVKQKVVLRLVCASSILGASAMAPKDTRHSAPIQNWEEDTRELEYFSVAPFLIPHAKKKHYGGEDTYFITKDGLAMGVFDGVGGWADSGVNPREYSYKIMEGCLKAAEEMPAESRTPLSILKAGWTYAKSIVGSSTACVATFSPKKTEDAFLLSMNIVNVGDSGVLVVNNDTGEVVAATKEQQHRFNCPYQLGHSNDTPDHGDKYFYDMRPGQTVVFGTDGLFDNLFAKEIGAIVTENKGEATQKVAEEIAKAALKVAKNKKAVSPFTRHAQAAGYSQRSALGGKEDDITVIVARFNPPKAKNAQRE
eukprot:TRINITY_DN15739_c0_g1_i1.p1 TRINITY_DN15739_c0_g1~~TRINITY_DN15739_c0_g1_i1.p1  ORF type:complete len:326 (+),score=70.79 TRINITY_DN15739_c0_g1_i1:24-980(+)